MTSRWTAAALAALAVAIGGCGSSGTSSSASGSGSASASKPNLTVSAAASLKAAFTAYAQQFSQANVRYSFAGSDVLAAQIEQGIKPDVFASANTKLPDVLYAKGLVSKPVTFAANATPGTASAAAEVMAAIVRVRVINLLPRDLDSGTQKHVGRGRVAASAAG